MANAFIPIIINAVDIDSTGHIIQRGIHKDTPFSTNSFILILSSAKSPEAPIFTGFLNNLETTIINTDVPFCENTIACILYGSLVDEALSNKPINGFYLPYGYLHIKEALAEAENPELSHISKSVAAFSLLMTIMDRSLPFMLTAKRKSRLVTEALRIIGDESSYVYGTSDIAGRIGTSPSHLSREFKKAMGITLTAYLNKKRITDAKALLLDRTLSITVIGQICGYSEVDYFCKVFKKQVGLTPSEYRQAHINITDKATDSSEMSQIAYL